MCKGGLFSGSVSTVKQHHRWLYGNFLHLTFYYYLAFNICCMYYSILLNKYSQYAERITFLFYLVYSVLGKI